MTRLDFLNSMKRFTEEIMKDLMLPVRAQEDGEDTIYRPPAVYRMRLPDMGATDKKAPYILHQLVTGDDEQKAGQRDGSMVLLRSVFCVYHPMPFDNPDEEEGMLSLVEVMERWRIGVLRTRLLDGRYKLDLDAAPLEALYYPDNMAPYYIGEFASNWRMPEISQDTKYLVSLAGSPPKTDAEIAYERIIQRF